MATTYDKIATTTLGSASSTITFSSIAASWTDLRLVFVYKDTTNSTQNTYMTFNSDTGTNYSVTEIRGNGSAASSYNLPNYNGALINAFSIGASSTYLELDTVDIFSYCGSTYKSFLISSNLDENGSGVVQNAVGLWRSTSAITSLTLQLGSVALYAIGTTATLYGIKSA